MRIQLARFERADFARLIQWIDSVEALHEWAGYRFEFPLTERQLEAHLEEAEREHSQRQVFRAIDADTRLVVGHIELTHIWPHLSGRASRVFVGSASQRERGIGTEVVRALVRYGFETFHFDRIDAGIVQANQSAFRCYEKCGFRQVGVWPDGYRSGQRNVSILWMTLRRSDWEQGVTA